MRAIHRRDLLAVGLLGVAIALFFWKLLFSNLILASGDTFFYIYPYWSAAAEAFRAAYSGILSIILTDGADAG